MKRALAIATVLAALSPAAYAQPEDEEAEEDSGDEEGDDEASEDEEAEAEPKAKAPAEDEEEATADDDGLPPKQNLTGHDEGSDKKPTEFERDRFFVDKVDTEKTENGTLVQGSIASSSFFYGESGGVYRAAPGGDPLVDPTMADKKVTNAGPRRMFTELRLQTDFRHIAGGKWEARIDARARMVNSPANLSYANEATPTTLTPSEPNRIQSGLYGENEYDVRELWLIRSGKRSDVFIGRQFVPDLGGLKIDGLRVDYAKSAKLTLIGFAGLMPVRGSRSVSTDYLPLKSENGAAAGRIVAAGGFGAAYRSVSAYGALGGVAQVPLKSEQPRVYLTSNGYLRNGAKLDLFHYALIDVLGTAAQDSTGKVQLTNLSGGANFKPSPRLRLTAAFHRVDTETLGVHAGAFLNSPDESAVGNTVVQNETYIQRIATNTARAGVSAGLGKQQRFEVSTAVSYRYRPAFDLLTPNNTPVPLPAAASIEVFGSVVDRRSIKDARIGLEASQSFAAGQLAYQRSVSFIGRLYVLREIKGGRGEWEAEASYTATRDTVLGTMLGCGFNAMGMANYFDCYGTSNNTLISVGGQLFYRLKQDWFGIGTLHLLRISNKRSDGLEDPGTLGVTGFLRIAKRF